MKGECGFQPIQLGKKPDHSTIAGSVSSIKAGIAPLFGDALLLSNVFLAEVEKGNTYGILIAAGLANLSRSMAGKGKTKIGFERYIYTEQT